MEVVIFLTLTWVIVGTLLFQKKELVFIENLILFLFFMFVNKNVLTLLSINLEMIEYSKEKHLFICFFLLRNIIAPFLMLIFVNAAFHKSMLSRIGWGIFMIIVGLLFEALAIELEILHYKKWSYGWSFILAILYFGTALGISKLYRHLLHKEGVVKV
ncbi:CBO0543 family protein [Sutcliffiella halmapala]|uniref:CBO0543 family protein n=1 Tax=Sutcliffiella halmapala TaxID=79882 RepID=UPI000995048F|nr:CBO0543 family protein [Sutcliffiella halmapala]